MFTGIITDIGIVETVEHNGKDTRLVISTGYDVLLIKIGASVACNGTCLTVMSKKKNLLVFDASYETLKKTAIGTWKKGARVNLEQAMKMGEEFGGHIVTGHIDGVGKIISRKPAGKSADFLISFPAKLKKFIAAKGSVVLNGVSLTVNEVQGNEFRVTIIPHTLKHTVFCDLQPGEAVSIEVDILARYVARILEVK